MKRCCRCGELKPETDFTRDRTNKDGLEHACRFCKYPPTPPIVLEISAFDLGWVVGFLEGEGTFGAARHKKSTYAVYKYIKVGATSTDRDVLIRLQNATGIGRIFGPYRFASATHQRKDIYRWDVNKTREAEALLRLIEPYMGERRREQIRVLLEAAEEVRPPEGRVRRRLLSH